MKIQRLKVQNFCCFEQESFDFSPGFNLFVGVNGSGKSSLLRAVAGSLATPLNGLGRKTVWLHEDEANARLALMEIKGRVRYEHCYPVRLEATGEIGGELRTWWMAQQGPGKNQNEWEPTVFSALSKISASIAQGITAVLPVVAFYTAARQWKLLGVSADTAVRQQDSRLDGYSNWDNAALDMQGLETWVVAKSLERLEAVSISGHVLDGGPLDELDFVNRAVLMKTPGGRHEYRYAHDGQGMHGKNGKKDKCQLRKTTRPNRRRSRPGKPR